jgi:hypothetical protein
MEKKARVTLTSSDPLYREKVDAIKKALSDLKDDEAFFSIDEFGPFAVKMRGGKALQPPGKVRQVPQWQRSKGSLIVTAALELSRNQITYFYSDQKNSTEVCKLIDHLSCQYKGCRATFLKFNLAPREHIAQRFVPQTVNPKQRGRLKKGRALLCPALPHALCSQRLSSRSVRNRPWRVIMPHAVTTPRTAVFTICT